MSTSDVLLNAAFTNLACALNKIELAEIHALNDPLTATRLEAAKSALHVAIGRVSEAASSIDILEDHSLSATA